MLLYTSYLSSSFTFLFLSSYFIIFPSADLTRRLIIYIPLYTHGTRKPETVFGTIPAWLRVQALCHGLLVRNYHITTFENETTYSISAHLKQFDNVASDRQLVGQGRKRPRSKAEGFRRPPLRLHLFPSVHSVLHQLLFSFFLFVSI